MGKGNVVLTAVDKAILESYRDFCEGLANYLGDGYEIVLHSLENLDCSVIKIINGHYTGRREGAPITDLALQMLENIRTSDGAGYIAYFARNKKGEPLRSTTITITGKNKRIIGLMCINFYLNTPMHVFLGNYLEAQADSNAPRYTENFVDRSNDPIEVIVKMRDEVMKDPSVSAHNKNKEIIYRLDAKGVFKLKDSVVQCAEVLGISKNTVYMHIRNARSATE